VTVYITEEEALQIARPIYRNYSILGGFPEEFFDSVFWNNTDQCALDTVDPITKLNCDRWLEYNGFEIGDEYLTYVSSQKNPTYIYNIGFTDYNLVDEPALISGNNWLVDTQSYPTSAAADLESDIQDCSCGSGGCLKVIYPSTAQEYADTLNQYLTHLKAPTPGGCEQNW
jgi:hypothetical protein